jgi:hypothetical protein
MFLKDNGGIRFQGERRSKTIPIGFSDQRSGEERRTDNDRRCGLDRRSLKGFRTLTGQDRRNAWAARV